MLLSAFLIGKRLPGMVRNRELGFVWEGDGNRISPRFYVNHHNTLNDAVVVPGWLLYRMRS